MSAQPPEHQLWIDKAEEDRLCISNELQAEQKPWSVICFHAQQAAEKYLKAYLVFKRVRPERTHDLRALLMRCVQFDSQLLTLESECRQLNDYAVDIRYPDVGQQIQEALCRAAVAACDRICDAISDRLRASC